jgi:NAD(P)-dependent dehydrogenase (short-subunit alcohol dehydrogenase family)
LAVEFAGSGVTINAVCPGYVDTQMTDRTLALVESRAGLSRDLALAAVLATTGQTRLLTPGEVSAAVLVLCMDDAAERSGEAVVLKGGVHAT